MRFRNRKLLAASLLGMLGLAGLWASVGSGAPNLSAGDHRTAVFYVA
jgi:hypothetical protein